MAEVVTDKNKIREFLGSRYIEAVFPSKEKAAEMIGSGRQLVFYLGVDPTGPDIHLGHTTNLLVLKKLIGLGHKVIFLIGDFTAQTGDPSDKEAARRPLSQDDVEKNMKSYLDQVQKILAKNSFELNYNSSWLAKLTFNDIRKIARLVTVQQMIGRDMFQKRLAGNKPITVEEFLYPLMQGYDSVAMEVDGEIGGNDQTFNMLVGRDLVGKILGKEKMVIATKLLEDPATGKKIMNKSEGRYISLNDSADEMFGKTMALPDQMIKTVFELCTERDQVWIDSRQAAISAGENPMVLKKELAFELVQTYRGEKEAEKARKEFERVFAEGQLPEKIEEFKMEQEAMALADLLKKSGLADSASEAKRLIGQKAVRVNDQTISDWSHEVKSGDVIKVGPRKFLRIV
jgi:tyrosyl-tRNA synthetase